MKPSQVALLAGTALSLGTLAIVTPSLARAQSEGLGLGRVGSVLGDRPVTLSVVNGDVREVLRALFQQASVTYSIAPDVQGTVSIHMAGASAEAALNNVLRQVDSDYTVEGGVVNVIHRKPRRIRYGSDPSDYSSSAIGNIAASELGSSSAVTSDSEFLFVVSGKMVAKVRKKDLAVVKVVQIPSVTYAPIR